MARVLARHQAEAHRPAADRWLLLATTPPLTPGTPAPKSRSPSQRTVPPCFPRNAPTRIPRRPSPKTGRDPTNYPEPVRVRGQRRVESADFWARLTLRTVGCRLRVWA